MFLFHRESDGTSSGSTGNPNVNKVDMMPTTSDPINTTTTTNVSQNVVDENLPQLLDSTGGSHVTNVPTFDKEDFTSWKVRFLVFFDGLEPYLLKIWKMDLLFLPLWLDVLALKANDVSLLEKKCLEVVVTPEALGLYEIDLTPTVGRLQLANISYVKKHAMWDKSSPLKRLVIEINVWVKLSEGENNFYHATDSYASNPTPIDCMERVSCESLWLSHPEGKIPTVLFRTNVSGKE
nr:hypothetical protein [Tanacetum cinerariifolium]